jgi:aconitate hydratase
MTLLNKQDIQQFYQNYAQQLSEIKTKLNRPLTFTEKIIYTHLAQDLEIQKGQTIVPLRVDRVAMQDATAQMALLQFMNTGKEKVAIPTTIHCDHLIQAKVGAREDLATAVNENGEVYEFLKVASCKYGIGFWTPGSGIIHQVVLENYALPGQLMIGTDSHTPNAGGLGMLAIGVGGADAVDVLAGEMWNVKMPKIIGVNLKGALKPWVAPKDIILKLAQILTVKGGTGCVIEYFGEGLNSISATGRATITNMGAEVGATSSIFPYDHKTADFLVATNKSYVTEYVAKLHDELCADPVVLQNPMQHYDELIEINLDALEPQVVGPHTPDLGRAISKLANEATKNDWPVELSTCLIGSCTNSSYEDLSTAADICMQAIEHGLKAKVPFLITPGSDQIYQTIKKEGWVNIFEQVGGKVLANACGPCIGMWKRDGFEGKKNSILTSFNRNFKKRNDANPLTHAFIASPELVTAIAFAGRLDFNPQNHEVDGYKFLNPQGKALPDNFTFSNEGYIKPSGLGEVVVQPNSQRIALLEPFTAWKESDFQDMIVLAKIKGKCTTDQISPAGKWLKYRGHLDKISDNLYSGAVSAFSDKVGQGKNQLTGEVQEFSLIARSYKTAGKGWVVVADENYGEGSSREHAAMEPRHLGCRMIIAKSFARIAESNLKRQGILAVTFLDAREYDKILEDDQISIDDIDLEEGRDIYLNIHHADGLIDAIACKHSFSKEQIEWFKAGSALEYLKSKIQLK